MNQRYKGLIIILDGLGDRPCSQLNGATPLEAAHTPHLDQLTTEGLCGLVDPLAPGVPVSTHTGTGILLGLTPIDAAKLSRGPVEAAGIGLSMAPGDIAIRCNFATLESNNDQLTVVNRRAGRISEGTDQLAQTLQNIPVGEGITATLKPATQHRAVLKLSGNNLSEEITDTDPDDTCNLDKALKSTPLNPDDTAAIRTANAINCFIKEAHSRLENHPINQQRKQQGLLPANGIITRGAGMLHQSRNIINHIGLKAALIAGESSVCGLGKLFEYTVITKPKFTALADTDLAAKVSAAKTALKDHDVVFLHIKAPDICAHDLMPTEKRDFLGRLDKALSPLLSANLVIGVSGDHSTNSVHGNHCADPVPTLLHYPDTRRDSCANFGESSCMQGGLGHITATGFLLTALDAMGVLHNYRPEDLPYFLTCQ
ncbi:2,3-bisphosphoglycerate-independent phosphoglycerate mutase [Pseudomonadota bacterium]